MAAILVALRFLSVSIEFRKGAELRHSQEVFPFVINYLDCVAEKDGFEPSLWIDAYFDSVPLECRPEKEPENSSNLTGSGLSPGTETLPIWGGNARCAELIFPLLSDT